MFRKNSVEKAPGKKVKRNLRDLFLTIKLKQNFKFNFFLG